MVKIEKTKDYDMFKYREDNRVKIVQRHVSQLVESIKARNLLELRPITVNQEMEVMDGQHRLEAAKILGVHIYYQVEKSLKPIDIITLNVAKRWTMSDYVNYYSKNGYVEYQKLEKFIKENRITIKVALNICMAGSAIGREKLRLGEYVFEIKDSQQHLDTCWDTINYIKLKNGMSAYTGSSRFWDALLRIIKHEEFDKNKWKKNLEMLVQRIGPKPSEHEYLLCLLDIYNWKNTNKIDIDEK